MSSLRLRLVLTLLALGAGCFVLAGAPGRGAAQARPAAAGSVHHDSAAPAGELSPSAGAEGGISHSASVIGTDDRTRVVNTAAFPYSTVVFLELYDEDNMEFGECTGTLVGPDAVLTAGHCLWDAELQAWTEHIRVIPGRDLDREPFGSVYATDWWVPDGYIASGGASDFDWGLVRLPPQNITNETRWMKVGVLADRSLAYEAFRPAIFGYPSDMPSGTMWGASRPRFTSIEPFRLSYDIDTAPGQSGSAIWSANPEREFFGYVVGIHTRGVVHGSPNSGSRIDQELLDDLVEGCRQMRCTIDFEVEDTSPPMPVLRFHAVGPALARD